MKCRQAEKRFSTAQVQVFQDIFLHKFLPWRQLPAVSTQKFYMDATLVFVLGFRPSYLLSPYMPKKKATKRVDSRREIEGGVLTKLQRYYDTGRPVSLIMLMVFAILTSVILSIPAHIPDTTVGGYWLLLRPFLQSFALLSILSFALGCYVAVYQPNVVKNYGRGAVLLSLLLIMVGAMELIMINDLSPYLLVVPVIILTIMLTIGYNQRFAMGMGAFGAIFSTIILRHDDMGVFLSICSGMALSALLLKEIRSRYQLIKMCVVVGVAVMAMVWAVGFWQNLPVAQIVSNSMWAGLSTVAVGFLMQGLLPLVERLFHTATSMTLLDYAEANKPLLKRLAVDAPGTFNHSWQIGMLSEAAADAVGANGLLCRVGSYYHDVGKLNKPRYFVENQAENFNQHRELSPTMSRMIIIGHVKDGVELAREYHLPKVIQQFIVSHHGTTLVEYFYHEATKKGQEMGHSVPETEFRYPGPKPQTKEAAIVMLTDAVEGATRAMSEPTPSRIEAVVNEMAMKRLLDGQFDECDMTMQELKQIEVSLIKSLCGMYHGRIKYPKLDKQDGSGRNGKATQVRKDAEPAAEPKGEESRAAAQEPTNP